MKRSNIILGVIFLNLTMALPVLCLGAITQGVRITHNVRGMDGYARLIRLGELKQLTPGPKEKVAIITAMVLAHKHSRDEIRDLALEAFWPVFSSAHPVLEIRTGKSTCIFRMNGEFLGACLVEQKLKVVRLLLKAAKEWEVH